MKNYIFLFVLIFFCLANPANASVKQQSPGIQKISFKGWQHAYRLYNDDAEAIIVPAVGRMMCFRLLNGDNVLNVSADNAGKIPPKNRNRYTFFGGFYTWLAPQSSGTPWPPNYEFDIGPYTITHIGLREITMISPIIGDFGIQMEKHFKLSDKGATLSVRIRLYNRTDILLRWSAWNLTAVKPTGIVFFELPADFTNPYNAFCYAGRDGKTLAKKHFDSIINILKYKAQQFCAVNFRQYKWRGDKLFVQPHSKFLAYRQQGSWFIRLFNSSGSFGDYNTQVQLWADKRQENIFELEVLAPDRIISPGKYIDWNEHMLIVPTGNRVDNYKSLLIQLNTILNSKARIFNQANSSKK